MYKRQYLPFTSQPNLPTFPGIVPLPSPASEADSDPFPSPVSAIVSPPSLFAVPPFAAMPSKPKPTSSAGASNSGANTNTRARKAEKAAPAPAAVAGPGPASGAEKRKADDPMDTGAAKAASLREQLTVAYENRVAETKATRDPRLLKGKFKRITNYKKISKTLTLTKPYSYTCLLYTSPSPRD